ncbi:MAG: DNA gyrase subunit A [Hyphomicrobiaceae bacterium]|jgi:DNA gyrase subunit A
MRTSYMDYAMSVIVGRALPDIRDGLKPVHRRILFAMQDLSNDATKPPKKSARIVGDVIGKYHPHGDSAVYDTMVRMAQDFAMRYPLVDGQGNFGSVDGDPAAAMRYTEVRMARITAEMLADIDKETVDFVPNYDESTEEPTVLPARIPNLLINGSSGIAVGMATNIPPHNLRGICSAVQAVIDDPLIEIDDLIRIVEGPDFPTGGIIYGRRAIVDAYRTGRGILQVRARCETETNEKTGRSKIIVTEIPYQVNKSRLIEKMAALVNDKQLEGISDLRDESDRDGMRIVIELKRDAVPQVVQNNLYKQTSLQESFGIIMLALIGGRPQLCNLKLFLTEFIEHRREIITRATAFDLRKAEARLHILEGLKIALDNLDAVIKLIRAAPDAPTARTGLMTNFGLSEIQAQAILDMRLQRLTGLERDKIVAEHEEVTQLIAKLRNILSNDQEVLAIISEDLAVLKDKYGDERRTEIVDSTSEISIEDMIVEEEMVVTVSHEGYIKRNPVSLYRTQVRGGRGITGAATKGDDFIAHMFTANTHEYILFFTNKGRVYWKKVHELPQAGRSARGKAIVNLLPLQPGETVSTYLPVREFVDTEFVLFSTAKGVVKKTPLMDYSRPRTAGIIAVNLADDDELISVGRTDGNQQVALATRNGMLVRFDEREARPMGRGAGGVRGVALADNDRVVAMEVVRPGSTLLTLSERGMGKRSSIDDYRLIRRGGRGVKTIKITDRTGPVVGVLQILDDEDEVVIVTDGGKLIRIGMDKVRVLGRNTQGVRLVRLDDGEKVVSVAPVADKAEDAEDVVDEAEIVDGGDGADSADGAETPDPTPADGDTDSPTVDDEQE